MRLQCGMPCSKLEVSTVQHGTLSGAGYLHQSPGEDYGVQKVIAEASTANEFFAERFRPLATHRGRPVSAHFGRQGFAAAIVDGEISLGS